MSKKLYFSVNAANGSGEHIGTICANTSEELKEKLGIACAEHFDQDIKIKDEVDINNFLQGRSGNVKIEVEIDEEKFDDEVFICQTWLY